MDRERLAQIDADLSKRIESLGEKHADLIEETAHLTLRAKALGATTGAQRLAMVCAHARKLSAEEAYQWINPPEFAQEVETAQEHRADAWHAWRNRLSLVPLLFTWFALTIAALDYESYLNVHPQEIDQPLLLLWQSGFHGTTPFTFSFAGALDVLLLALVLIFTIRAQVIERAASKASTAFAKDLEATTSKLLTLIDAEGALTLSPDADINEVANAMQRVINQALKAGEDVANAGQKAIADTNARVNELFTSHVMPLMTQFRTDMATLHTELGNYQQRLGELTNASSQISTAANGLVTNADKYTKIGEAISLQISALDQTQQQLVGQIGKVTGSVGTAASSVEEVAKQMTTSMRSDIEQMTKNVMSAARALQQVESQLIETTRQLEYASASLATVQIIGGGLIGWLIRRRGRRRGVVQP